MIGQTVSHYRILEKLGEGGMGVVYMAEDTHLERRVAIKFLATSSDENFRARFLREARAISALSHPNVATIFDYGESEDGEPFIVMELIEGQTLTELLLASALTLSRAVEIIESVAQALGAAHARGIIHRDIKPSNVVIDMSGAVKVLDFGLAKRLDEDQSERDAGGGGQADTLVETRNDVVVGTPLYLSPEQARSAPVDARSDLFALGALLYECISGRPAFEAANVFEIGVQVIHFNPPLPSAINARIPPELDRITMKALAKKPDERYQSAQEMLEALRAWRASSANVYYDELRTQRQRVASATTETSALRSITAALEQPRLSIRFMLLTLVIACLSLWGILRWVQRTSSAPFQTMQLTRLTNSGKSVDAVISPDGKYIVYVTDEVGQQSLWVKHIPTTSNVQIVSSSDSKYWGLTFSRDGNYVYYVVWEKNGPGTLYQVPVLGGRSRKLIASVDSPITFSPDGKMLAFIRRQPSLGETVLMTANADGSREQMLALRKSPEVFSPIAPAWSPDGKMIACATGNFYGGFHSDVVAVSLEGGAETLITSQKWFYIDGIVWLGTGNGLILTAAERSSSHYQIWQVEYPGGEARRVTNDLSSYISVSLTADSSALAAVQYDRLSNIWIVPGSDTTRAVQITSGVGHHYGLSWTPDAHIVYSSMSSGNPDIWMMKEDGTGQKQLTFDEYVDRDPSVSPDGRYIIFASDRVGSFNIWRMNLDGTNLVRLTSGHDERFPQWSPDGQWVVYQGFVSGVPMLWKIPVDGGNSIQLSDKYSNWPVVSPDGRLIACSYRDGEGSPWKVAVIPFEGGAPAKLFDIPMLSIPMLFWQRIRWSADGRALTYIDNRGGVSNIWSQSLDGGEPTQLTNFKSDRILNFEWSPDGKRLACVRGMMTSDVVLISDLK
ncbi:MAG: protein kinase [Pyrinomonadaceae bacterium]